MNWQLGKSVRIRGLLHVVPMIAAVMVVPASAQTPPAARAAGAITSKTGVDAWSRGDFLGAVRVWQPLAARGDVDAQFDLAQAYRMGRGVPIDLAKAEDLYGRAAAQGHLQAGDLYGVLLYQRGEHAAAMPYLRAASDRGDPRAQFLVGISLFNGDGAVKDWVRAYALVSLAQQSGLPQARPALAQMDKFIPIEQRQQAVAMAGEIAQQTEATRARQMAVADLGTHVPAAGAGMVGGAALTTHMAMKDAGAGMVGAGMAAPGASFAPARPLAQRAAPVYTPPQASGGAAPMVGDGINAGYAPPHLPPAPTIRPRAPYAMAPTREVPPTATRPALASATHMRPPAEETAGMAPEAAPLASTVGGAWKVQLGAFGVAANAEAMWSRVKGMPGIAGHTKMLVPTGKVNRLMAGGYSAQGAALACHSLAASGVSCIATRN